MNDQNTLNALKRILEPASRRHLQQPFRTSSLLRSKYFPGAGRNIQRARLLDAYIREIESPNTDWQLIAHGTWPWVQGHEQDLAFTLNDLSRISETVRASGASDAVKLDAGTYKSCVERFTQVGAEEIGAFVDVFARAGVEYREAVIRTLAAVQPADARPDEPGRPAFSPASPQPGKASVAAPDVTWMAPLPFHVVLGAIFFFAVSLAPVGIQYWRQPDQGHPIVLGIAGFFGLILLVALADYWRKRRAGATDPSVAGYLQICDDVAREFGRNLKRYGDRLRCGKGCTDCCHHIFQITEIEAAYVSLGVKTLPEALRKRLVERARLHLPKRQKLMSAHGRIEAWGTLPEPDMRLACPALENGVCVIYDHRPLVCRKFGIPIYNPDNPDRIYACELNFKPGEEIVDDDLIPIQTDIYGRWIGIQRAYRRAGGRLEKRPISVARAILEDFIPYLPTKRHNRKSA